MKKRLERIVWLVFLPLLPLLGCGEEGGLKGILRMSVVSTPIVDHDVKSVNLIITNMEGLQNGEWRTLRNFETPMGINTQKSIGLNSTLVMDQYMPPGEFEALRISLNVAQRNTSLIINPQTNIVFNSGNSSPLYMNERDVSEIVVEQSFGVSSRGLADLVLFIDMGKSISINSDSEYVLHPNIQIIPALESGHIKMNIINKDLPSGVIAYAYVQGSYSSAEISSNSFIFPKSSTSVLVNNRKVGLSYLKPGDYEIIYAKILSGQSVEVIGKTNSVKVIKGQTLELDINLTELSPT